MKRKLLSFFSLATIAATPLAVSAQPYPYGGYGTTYGYGYGARASGVIASVNGGAITLRNGRTIFLKNGTQIAPSGQGLAAGERISVRGYDAGNGNVNAQSIDILGYGGGTYGNRGNDGYGRNDRDDRYDRERHGNDDDRYER